MSACPLIGDQRQDALALGNVVRTRRAQIKRQLKTGKLRASTVVVAGEVNISILDVLTAMPRVGVVKAGEILTEAERRLSDGAVAPSRLSFDHRVAGSGQGRRRPLTQRERRVLGEVIAEFESARRGRRAKRDEDSA